jgi:DNA-directed RNA polymerase specialized sigma24 family protein
MQIHWTYAGCDEQDEFEIERCWQNAQLALDGKLQELPDVPVQLRMAAEQLDSAPHWQLRAALHVPGHTLVAHAHGESVAAVVEEVARALADRIDHEIDLHHPSRARLEGTEDLVPLLETWYSQGRSNEFISFLVPVVRAIGSYVERELSIGEHEGIIVGEEITSADVLNQVLVDAWDRFSVRDTRLPLDLWAMRMADDVIGRLGKPVAEQSLDDEAPLPTREPNESMQDEWVEQATYPETIELSELLPEQSPIAAWDDLEMDEKQVHLSAMLAALSRNCRQAFVLNLAHGFSTSEIADFQDRQESEVLSDIDAAIAHVRHVLNNEDQEDAAEPFAKAELRRRRGKR